MPQILRTFPNEAEPMEIIGGEGMTITAKNGHQYWDMTGGFTAHAVLGWNNREVIESIKRQVDKIGHIDYKSFVDPNRSELADVMLRNASHGLDRLFLCGGSGGEACEAAMHLSYQVHYESGKRSKQWFISREQSYHGATTDSMAIGERPNLAFYAPMFPKKRAKISEHNHFRHRKDGESLEAYGRRSAQELELKILELGPENVCAFIAETMQGGLVGDVPPTENYWKEIRSICSKYDVHMILDEVWCGCGVSGKNFCIDWYDTAPDFIFVGKTFAAGYQPISAVVTGAWVEEVIKSGSGRVENSTTFQGHSVAVAAALACQKILSREGFLDSVDRKGRYFRRCLNEALSDNDFFCNVRGRGMRNSLEYKCIDSHLFGTAVMREMKDKHSILISGKWHRLTFSNSMLITEGEIDRFVEILRGVFNDVASKWTSAYRSSVRVPELF